MTVYVTQQPMPNKLNWVPDLSPAAPYGKLVFVFAGDEAPFTAPNKSMTKAQDVLAHFNSKEDYLLWPNTGDPAAQWICIMALASMGVEEITFLYWSRVRHDDGTRSRSKGNYVPVTIAARSTSK